MTDSNLQNILQKITNVVKKYQSGMNYEEIQLALTSQWLKISEFSQRPIILQLKLFCTLLQFTILSKDGQNSRTLSGRSSSTSPVGSTAILPPSSRVNDGIQLLGNYFGKLLNVTLFNSILWRHVQSFGASILSLIVEIQKTGIYQSHTLSLTYEGDNFNHHV